MNTDLTGLFKGMAAIIVVTAPFGVWKLVEIAVYVWKHMHWSSP